MTSVADFIKIPKTDSHNNLDLGMRYSSFVTWAGFYVPGYPENNKKPEKSVRDTIKSFTQIRIGSEKDLHNLFCLTLSEAAADNTTVINATINNALLDSCDTPEVFVNLIKTVADKYSSSIKLVPVLALDADSISETTLPMAGSLLGSGIFKGIYLYGKNILTPSDTFKNFVKGAEEHNLKIRLNSSVASTEEDFLFLCRTYKPSGIVSGETNALSTQATDWLKQNKTTIIVTPDTDFASESITLQKKAEAIRTLLDAGAAVKPATESILLYNKSLSQFASNLCNTGLFTKEEMITFLS